MHSCKVILKRLLTLTSQVLSPQNIPIFKLNKFYESRMHGSPGETKFKE